MDRAGGKLRGDAAPPSRSGRQGGEHEREVQLRQHAEGLRAQAVSVRQQVEQDVERARTAFIACQDAARRAEAALSRAYANAARERASVARSQQRGEEHAAPRERDFAGLADRVSELRQRTAKAAASFAEAEEQVAYTYEQLAARQPGKPEYKRRAHEAREAMRRAREIQQKYSS